MRIIIATILVLSSAALLRGQGFNYQAVVRNAAGDVLISQQVPLSFQFVQNGNVVCSYAPSPLPFTNNVGVVNIAIAPTPDCLSALNWAQGGVFMRVFLGSDQIGNDQVFRYVPYAYVADTVRNAPKYVGNGDVVVNGLALSLGSNVDSDKNNDVTKTDNFAGDVTGTYNTTRVTRLHGRDIFDDPNIADGKILTWNATTQRWEPQPPASSDNWGTQDVVAEPSGPILGNGDETPLSIKANSINSGYITDLSIQSVDLADNAVTTSKIADGSVTASKIAGSVDLDADNDLLKSTVFSGDVTGTYDDISVTHLRGTQVNIASPIIPNGNVLAWNAATASWEPQPGGWGSQTAQTLPPLSGNGTAASPLGIQNGAIIGAHIADGTITANKLAPGVDANSADDLLKSDAFGGDVSGLYNNLSVTRLRGSNVSATAPSQNGQVLGWNAATQQWEPQAGGWGAQTAQVTAPLSGNGTSASPLGIQSGAITGIYIANGTITANKLSPEVDGNNADDVLKTSLFGGDVAGAYDNLSVTKIQGQNISAAAPTSSGQVLTWDAATGRWEAQDPAVGTDNWGTQNVMVAATSPLTGNGDEFPLNLKPNSINSSYIPDNAIITPDLANLAVTEDKLADSSVSTLKLTDLAVTEAKLADSSVSTLKLTDLAVTEAKLADSSVSTLKLTDLAVTEVKLADSSVSTLKLIDLAVTGAKIADSTITTAKLVDSAVTNFKLASLAVTTPKLADLAVTGIKIADSTITTAKLVDSVITNAKLANFAVTTPKLGDLAVTNSKIANLAVNSFKLADTAVTTAKIDNFAVTSVKLASGSVTNPKLGDNSVTTNKLLDGSVNSSKILNNTILFEDLSTDILSSLVWTSGTGGDIYYIGGNTGIGTDDPKYRLEVTSADSSAIVGRFTGFGNFNRSGVVGYSSPAAGFGYGGYFTGGNAGVYCTVTPGTAFKTALFAKAGDNSQYAAYFDGEVAYTGNLTSISDQRLKDNIAPVTGSLNKLMQLHPKTYTYKKIAGVNLARGAQMGFLAQEVEQVLPELVHSINISAQNPADAITDAKGVNYTGLIPVMTGAIQEQQLMIEALKKELEALRLELQQLKSDKK